MTRTRPAARSVRGGRQAIVWRHVASVLAIMMMSAASGYAQRVEAAPTQGTSAAPTAAARATESPLLRPVTFDLDRVP